MINFILKEVRALFQILLMIGVIKLTFRFLFRGHFNRKVVNFKQYYAYKMYKAKVRERRIKLFKKYVKITYKTLVKIVIYSKNKIVEYRGYRMAQKEMIKKFNNAPLMLPAPKEEVTEYCYPHPIILEATTDSSKKQAECTDGYGI